MNVQQIEDAIVSALKTIPIQSPNGASKTERTKAIKIAISELGYKHNYFVCGDPRPGCDGAFLCDLSWYTSTPAPEGNLLEMPLALESEWHASYKQIKYDFEKLLVAKSKFKVMVFQASGRNAANYFKQLEQGIRNYQGGSFGEIYLLEGVPKVILRFCDLLGEIMYFQVGSFFFAQAQFHLLGHQWC